MNISLIWYADLQNIGQKAGKPDNQKASKRYVHFVQWLLRELLCSRKSFTSFTDGFALRLCDIDYLFPAFRPSDFLKTERLAFWLSGLLAFWSAPCFSWSTSLPFEVARPLYIGARALGMGNAFTAVADDATAGFWNPAGLIQWQGVKVFGMRKMYNRKDYAFDPKGIGYSYRGNAFFWGNKIALGVDSGTPDFNYYSFARQVNAYVAVGLSLKFTRKHPASYYQFFGYEWSYNVGILSRPSRSIQVGILLQNIPARRSIRWISTGFSYHKTWIVLSTDVIVSTGSRTDIESHFGIEWRFNKYLHFRTGLSAGHPTVGLGIKIWNLRLDYAWIRETKESASRDASHVFHSHFVSAEFFWY